MFTLLPRRAGIGKYIYVYDAPFALPHAFTAVLANCKARSVFLEHKFHSLFLLRDLVGPGPYLSRALHVLISFEIKECLPH